MRLVSDEDLATILAAAVESGIVAPDRVELLFAGLPASLIHDLPTDRRPRLELSLRLEALNGMMSAPGADEPPLLTWMANAASVLSDTGDPLAGAVDAVLARARVEFGRIRRVAEALADDVDVGARSHLPAAVMLLQSTRARRGQPKGRIYDGLRRDILQHYGEMDDRRLRRVERLIILIVLGLFGLLGLEVARLVEGVVARRTGRVVARRGALGAVVSPWLAVIGLSALVIGVALPTESTELTLSESGQTELREAAEPPPAAEGMVRPGREPTPAGHAVQGALTAVGGVEGELGATLDLLWGQLGRLATVEAELEGAKQRRTTATAGVRRLEAELSMAERQLTAATRDRKVAYRALSGARGAARTAASALGQATAAREDAEAKQERLDAKDTTAGRLYRRVEGKKAAEQAARDAHHAAVETARALAEQYEEKKAAWSIARDHRHAIANDELPRARARLQSALADLREAERVFEDGRQNLREALRSAFVAAVDQAKASAAHACSGLEHAWSIRRSSDGITTDDGPH